MHRYEVRDGRWLYKDGVRVEYRPTPNRSPGRMTPTLVVWHDTADHLYPWDGLSWLTNRKSRVSAHLHFARDGTVVQLAPLDAICWHAGKSWWRGKPRVNGRGIGNEMDNPGKLTRIGNKVRAWFGDTYDLADVKFEQTKLHGKGYWMPYTNEQMEAAKGVAEAIARGVPSVDENVRHCDVSPGRKVDTNPLFGLHEVAHAFDQTRDRQDEAPLKLPAPAVVAAQQRLNELGYNAGFEDGDAGTRTKMAAAGFQMENSLPVTGELDHTTQSALLDKVDAKPMPTGARAEITAIDIKSRTVRTANLQQLGSNVTVISGITAGVVGTFDTLTKALLGPNGIGLVLIITSGLLIWSGIRNGWFAKKIKGYRIEDAKTGRHVSS